MTLAIRALGLALCLLLVPVISQGGTTKQFSHAKEKYHLEYPDGWYIHTDLLEAGAPLTLVNVAPADLPRGGILPLGGAEIVVQIRPSDLDEGTVLESLHKGDHPVRSSHQFRTRAAQRLDFTYEIAPGISYSRAAVSTRVGKKMFLVTLTYRQEGAPKPLDYEQALTEVVASLADDPDK